MADWKPGRPRGDLARVSAQGQKGARFEQLVLPLLEMYYPGVYRLRNQGAKDKGDFKLDWPTVPFVIQAKWWDRPSLGVWVDDATKQASVAGVPVGVVVHKRRGKTDPYEQFATMKLGDFLWLMNDYHSR